MTTVDRDPLAPGFAFATERAVLSSEDEQGVERLARAREVDGLVSPGADWPVGIAARVAERMGLPHPIDGATAVLATTKTRQRERFAAAGIDVYAFDYRGFGSSEGHPRQTISLERQLADFHSRAERSASMGIRPTSNSSRSPTLTSI